MSVADTLNTLATKVSELYREIVTTSVRFDELQKNTDRVLTRMEATIDQLTAKVAVIHDQHVREKAALEAQIAILEGRLAALSEHALHAVIRDVARELATEAIRDESLSSSPTALITKPENDAS